MKILIYSYFFPPAIGGMGRLMEMLAEEFVRRGHTVELFAEVGGEGSFPFPVTRAPSVLELYRGARRSEVILTAPLSLRGFIPQVLSGRPIAVAHPDLLGGRGLKGLTAAIKRVLTRFVTNIAPSRFLSASFPRPVVILNTYDERLFRWPDDGAPRSGVIFVGRLEEWKGCRTLVEAFALIADEWPDLRLTIVGDGTDLPMLKRMTADLSVDARVDFAGILLGEDLARSVAKHDVMVVPSIGAEPFGIVALEGLASGCRLIVSDIGGLPEAVGPHAVRFTPGNAQELAARLREVLSEPDAPGRRAAVERHLESYAPAVIAERYLEVFRAMAR